LNAIHLRRHETTLLPDSKRVIVLPFIPIETQNVTTIIDRALALPEEDVAGELKSLRHEFEDRHIDIESKWLAQFEKVSQHGLTHRPLSRERKWLIGALFSGEYSLESAGLFNPSIVPHPDQGDAPEGGLRFIMSLRATGERHISSIEFRSGAIAAEGRLTFDPVSRLVTEPRILSDPTYQKRRFRIELLEMGVDEQHVQAVLAPLGDRFRRSDLDKSADACRHETHPATHELFHALDCIQWLADSNSELRFPDNLTVCERAIIPVSAIESNGIEDARFVRFVDDDATVTYYATCTAYNGQDILPELIRTDNFLRFDRVPLKGDAVQNKGMALFPRRINGRYFMLSRQDGENLFIMSSHSLHHWSSPRVILRPHAEWESVKVGNCGSPMETEAGWLVITHGVGPMRKYSIGAALLDLDDPAKVIGRLGEPLLCAEGDERNGYVPNVVYSCGSLIHGRELILPYGISDWATSVANVSLDDLLAELQANPTEC